MLAPEAALSTQVQEPLARALDWPCATWPLGTGTSLFLGTTVGWAGMVPCFDTTKLWKTPGLWK